MKIGQIASLANLDPQPESVPINQLVRTEGTPLENAEDLDWTEFVRTIAVARITMPHSPARSARVSFMPTMPPQHTFSPAWRILPSVSMRSSWRRVWMMSL